MRRPSPFFSFLALGDSYTIGESVAFEERWPSVLCKALETQGLFFHPPCYIAKTGWTTNELAQGIQEATLKETFHFVSLLVGVNNQYRGYPLEQYFQEFQALLERAIRYVEGQNPQQVLVLSIPDWGQTPFATGRDRAKISQEIDAFNQVNQECARKANTWYADITTISRQVPHDLSLVAPDQLHPSAKMYQQWSALLVELLFPLWQKWKEPKGAKGEKEPF
jgi:lysophospholipase L1-like esterase